MRLITDSEVQRLLQKEELVHCMEEGFRTRYLSVRVPVRTQVATEDQSVVLFMPCYDPANASLGMKVVKVRPHAPAGERVRAQFLLLDPASGAPQAVIEGNALTDLRTAAVSAVATRFLARENAAVLAVFGTGRQARAHVRVLPAVHSFTQVLVCGSTVEAGEAFAHEVARELGIEAHAAGARMCASQADVICTCTTSDVPLFEGAWLRPGTHLNLVGAFRPQSREVDDSTVARARVVVDTYAGALAEAGDLLIPMNQGTVGREHIVAELHELIAGKKVGRRAPNEITLFKSVGYALEDLIAAELVLQAALREQQA